MRKYEKSVIEHNLKKTYSELQNVIRRSEADNGSVEGWDYTIGTQNFVKTYIAPYMYLRECRWYGMTSSYNAANCFDKNIGIWRDGITGEPEPEGILHVSPKYTTKDGRYIAIVVTTGVYMGQEFRNLYFYVDVNGSAGKSIYGQDVYKLTLSNYRYYNKDSGTLQFGGEPYSGHGNYRWSTELLRKNCYLKTGISRRSDCGLLIQRNGWKFPSDYPFSISELRDSL
jgi:hypothetical protein